MTEVSDWRAWLAWPLGQIFRNAVDPFGHCAAEESCEIDQSETQTTTLARRADRLRSEERRRFFANHASCVNAKTVERLYGDEGPPTLTFMDDEKMERFKRWYDKYFGDVESPNLPDRSLER